PVRKHPDGVLDGRYADDAMKYLLEQMHKAGTFPKQYEVKMFGGGNMFPHLSWPPRANVSMRNIERGRELMKENGLQLKAEHLGGNGHRQLVFDIWSGEVQVRHERERKALAK
ncbi:MAG: chemotaxis protein CheD, partial [Pseudomonadota bacterium]|nr:chemotaxis protein CheD [Pseudomonadota bacterium]